MNEDCHCEPAAAGEAIRRRRIASSQETLLAMTAMKKEVEDDDPFEMVGIGFDGQSEEELKDMALCFAEEFIREGWDEMELFYMFQSPFYVGPHMVWKQKGDDYVKAVISEAVAMWRPRLRQTMARPGLPAEGGIQNETGSRQAGKPEGGI